MPDNDNLDRLLSEILQKKSSTRLETLLDGYHLSSLSEGKSPDTIAIIEASVRYLEEFLVSNGFSTDVMEVGVGELRRFTVYLKERPRFAPTIVNSLLCPCGGVTTSAGLRTRIPCLVL